MPFDFGSQNRLYYRRSLPNECTLRRQRAEVERVLQLPYSRYRGIAILLLECLELARLRSEALSARSASEVNAALIRTTPRPSSSSGEQATADLAHPRPRCTAPPLRGPTEPIRARPAPATVNIGFFGAIYEGTPRIQGRSFNPKPNPCTKAVSWLVHFAECFLTP